jgi:putative methanogenesis marker protein 6
MSSKNNTLEDKSEDIKVTRMIVLGPASNVSQSELVGKLHMLELPLVIKSTCYGAVVHGKEKDVMEAIYKIRKLDPSNIFTKDRGFPPGDPRRCRARRGGAREGFHQLEKEYELLEYVGEALDNPKKVSLVKKGKINPDEFKKIAQECEK